MKNAHKEFIGRVSVSVIAVGALLSVPALANAAVSGTTGVSGATGTTSTTIAKSTRGATGTTASVETVAFTTKVENLEAAASRRQGQLVKLTTAVTGSASLTAADRTTLSDRLAVETAGVSAIVTKVPSDTTNAQLQADSASLIKDNRVFAVMTPQVNITTEIDAHLPRLSALSVSLSAITGDTSSLSALITSTSTLLTTARTDVLAQTPAGFPGNSSVFTQAKATVVKATAQIASIAAAVKKQAKKTHA